MRGQKRVEDARRRAGVPRINAVTAAKQGHDHFNLIEKRTWPTKLRKRTEPNLTRRHAARKRSITAAGIGTLLSRIGSSASKAAHTLISFPSTESCPSMEIRCATSKRERRNSVTSEAISSTSLNLAGARKRALASTRGKPM